MRLPTYSSKSSCEKIRAALLSRVTDADTVANAVEVGDALLTVVVVSVVVAVDVLVTQSSSSQSSRLYLLDHLVVRLDHEKRHDLHVDRSLVVVSRQCAWPSPPHYRAACTAATGVLSDHDTNTQGPLRSSSLVLMRMLMLMMTTHCPHLDVQRTTTSCCSPCRASCRHSHAE